MNYLDKQNVSIKNRHKQEGATLITALTFLLLMTVVTVSAMRISIVDVLVAGNDQQKALVYVSAETGIGKNTSFYAVYKESIAALDEFNGVSTETVINKGDTYQCVGINGSANSIGPSVPPCRIYDIKGKGTKTGTSITDTHIKSVGKEIPNPNS